MSEHPNATLVRRGYEAFNTADLATLTEMIREDATFYQPGAASVSGEYTGRDAVLGYFGQLAELSEGTFRAQPEQLFASDRQVVVVHHATARRNGAELDTHTALVFTLDGERIAAFDAVQLDQDAWDAFFPPSR